MPAQHLTFTIHYPLDLHSRSRLWPCLQGLSHLVYVPFAFPALPPTAHPQSCNSTAWLCLQCPPACFSQACMPLACCFLICLIYTLLNCSAFPAQHSHLLLEAPFDHPAHYYLFFLCSCLSQLSSISC